MAGTKTTQNIIIDAIRMLGEYSEQFENVPPHVETQGLDKLNDLLGWLGGTGITIPFYSTFDLNLEAGKKEYVISNELGSDLTKNPISELIFVNIVLSNTFWPVDVVQPGMIFDRVFNDEALGRPYQVLLEKNVDTSKLIFFPNPDQAYTANIKAKLEFSEIVAFDTLDEIPSFWHRYLKYKLASDLLPFYPGANWTPKMEADLNKMDSVVMALASQNEDFSFDVDSSLVSGDRYGYYRRWTT